MDHEQVREADRKRKFSVYSMIGAILVSIGIIKLIEFVPLDDVFIAVILIVIGTFIFLMGQNIHYHMLYPK